jgi:hypothetical protein
MGLLAAPWLQSFKSERQPWRPMGSRLGLKTIVPMTLFFILTNLFVLIFSWWPADLRKSLHTKLSIVPPITGPILGSVFLLAGAVY